MRNDWFLRLKLVFVPVVWNRRRTEGSMRIDERRCSGESGVER